MNILDKRFIYTPSHATDIRKTFAKARAEQAAQKRAPVSTPAWVTLLSTTKVHKS